MEEENVEEVPEPPMEEPEEKNLDEVSEKLDEVVELSKIERCKTKKDYILNIKKLTDKYSDRELVRTKKDALKDILTEEFERSIQKVTNHPDIKIEPDKNRNLVVNTMYRLTLGCCTLIEGVSKSYNEYFNGFCLDNYAQTIDSNPAWKLTLLDVLAEVYNENSEMLTAMMTKEGRLMFVLVMAGAASCKSYKSINGDTRRHQDSLEQDDLSDRKSQFRKVEPCPSNYFASRRRKKQRTSGPSRPDHSLRERGKLPTMEVVEEAPQSVPPIGGISDRGVFSDQCFTATEGKAPAKDCTGV